MEERILTLAGRLFRQAARCSIYALRADKDKQPHLAVLFQALAESHTRQAQRFLLQARGFLGTTKKNIQLAYEEELPALIDIYEALQDEAGKHESKAIATGCKQSSRVEQMNRNLLQRLGDDPQTRMFYICDFCGFISPDDAPDSCPICTAPKKRFIKVAP